jgi:hypothetical protein
MHEWIHICSDIDNGQDVGKATKTFLWLKNDNLCQFLELQKKTLAL